MKPGTSFRTRGEDVADETIRGGSLAISGLIHANALNWQWFCGRSTEKCCCLQGFPIGMFHVKRSGVQENKTRNGS